MCADTNIKSQLWTALREAIAEWPLESHPFMQRFAAGDFDQDAIRWWAIKMLPGSNRFNQAFLKVTSRVDDYRARILLLNNIYSEHGELVPDAAHVALYMRFMTGIGCSRIDVHEDDGAFRVPELRFKRFEIEDNEPIIWSLGRFAAMECVLPGIFTLYIEGLRRIFPEIDDDTIEYFPIHCELDPEHTDQLLQVASLYVSSDIDVMTFQDGVRDMLLSMSDMFSWLGRHMDAEAGTDEVLRSTLADQTAAAATDRHRCHADLYDAIYDSDENSSAQAGFVLSQLDVPQPSVLDLSARTGTLARLLADQGVRITGTDSSEALLELARRKVPEGRFVAADIRSFTAAEQFDAVVCTNGALHLIHEPQDIVRVLRQAKGHLKPGGVLIVELLDRAQLPPDRPEQTDVAGCERSRWLPRRGQQDSDLYALSSFDATSGRHVLEVANHFHTDAYRVANWARLAGLDDVQLRSGYTTDQGYDRAQGTGTVVMVARRSDPARLAPADDLTSQGATASA